MSYEEAKAYYGEELCNLLIKIYNFCKQSGYVIYQHATDINSANSIMKNGFICSISEINSISSEVLQNGPIENKYDDNGVKTSIYYGGQCQLRQNSIRDELSDTQHFFENTYCNLDFNSLTNPDINRSGFGATCIFVVSKEFSSSREYKQFEVAMIGKNNKFLKHILKDTLYQNNFV